MAAKKKAAPDKTLGGVLDSLFKLRERRKLIEAQAEVLKKEEKLIEDDIFARFKKGDLEGARGKLAQAAISTSDIPTLEAWDDFAKYLKKHPDDLDLLQRRLSPDAVRARWADKVVIPGVGIFTRITLKLTKVTR